MRQQEAAAERVEDEGPEGNMERCPHVSLRHRRAQVILFGVLDFCELQRTAWDQCLA